MAFNFGNALGGGLTGGLGGAASGALLGSLVAPGIGTALGAGIGGLAGLLGGGLSAGTGQTGPQSGFEQTPNKYNAEQQKALGQSLSMGQQNLQNPYAGFEPIEQAALNRFKKRTLPGLAERFTALGGSDTRGSSGLLGSLSGASSDLEQGLAALKAEYGQRNQMNALRQLELGLTPQQDWIYFGQRPDIGSQLLQTSGNVLGNYLGGGGTLGSLFGGGMQQGGQQGNIILTPEMQQKLMRLLQLRGLV